MNIEFKKIIGDLRINPGRTILIIIALVIGLWGVGSILVSYTILSRDLNENFKRTDSPHVEIVSEDFKLLNLDELRNRPEIEKAEFRDLSSLRIETRPDEWIPLWLFGVEDFSNFELARFFDRTGGSALSIPEDGEMVFERDGLKFSKLNTGLSARVRSRDKVIDIPIAGIVFDPAQAPGTQDHLIYGYVNKKTYTEITGEETNKRLIVRFKNVESREDVQNATDKLIEYFKLSGINATKFSIPKFNSHPHQWQLNTLLFLEGSIGFLAFFLGAVLVSQLMAAILAKQIRQIGILKAIGASKRKVFLIYISMVIVLGVISGAIAIPLAIKSGYLYAYFVANIINFEIITISLPHEIYLYLIGASLLLPVLLSLPVILKGTKISVRDAISDYGIKQEDSPSKNTTAVQNWLQGIFAMALRNTMRRKKRFVITVFSIALGVGIFNTGFNVQRSLYNLLSDVNNSMKHDVQVALINPIPKEKALKYFEGIDNISSIETWNGGRGAMQSKVLATDEGVGIVALPYNSNLISFRTIDGRWLNGSDEPEIVINQEASMLYNQPAIGSIIILNLNEKVLKAKLVGIVNEFEKAKVYIDQNLYDKIANPNHDVNSLMFVAKDKSYDKVLALKRDIEKAIAPSSLQILYVMMQAERVKIIYDHLYIVLITVIFFATLVLIVSAMGMASATSINIMERTREIGVLRAIGAVPGTIYKIFVSEGMIVSMAGIIAGMFLSWPLSILASNFFGNLMLGSPLQPAFSHTGLVITVISTFVFGWLASSIPARKAVKVSTREALSYE